MNKRFKIFTFIFTIALFSLTACDQTVHATRGFRLPEGDIANGEKLFGELQCLACHSVAEKDAGDIVIELTSPVPLGGKVAIAKNYAQLLTSVINPSHSISKNLDPARVQRDGQSLMRNYNDIISVTELIDLVTYVETLFELVEPEKTKY